MKKVFIDGSAGTTGLRIHERLAKHRGIELVSIDDTYRKDINKRAEVINSADAAFLCLPDDAARDIVSALGDSDTKIFDTSTAHRTESGWAYGFPELSDAFYDKIKNGTRIAVPGCHASGFISVCYPLVEAGILPKDYPLVCYSITGYSGGGKKMIAQYEAPDRCAELDSPRQYGLGQSHKHLKEMKAICELEFDPVFSPIVSDFYSGMVVSVPLFPRLLNGNPSAREIHSVFAEHYKNQQFVKVMPFGADGFLAGNSLSGKDYMQIEVTGNDNRVLIASCFDNLGKGSSGAAVECMNIALGFNADEGLDI